MARPRKQGLDYFPLDVDIKDNAKISMLIAEFGYKGELLYLKVLSYLYAHNGYFVLYCSEEERLKLENSVAYITGGSGQSRLLNELVARCVKRGLFDETVFNDLGILTSRRAQETWLEVVRKRTNIVVDKRIWLLDSVPEIPVFAAETTVSDPKTKSGKNQSAEKTLVFSVGNQAELGFRGNPRRKPPVSAAEMTQSKVIHKEENIKEETIPPVGEPTYWQRQRTAFLSNQLFFETLCLSKNFGAGAARALQEEFLTNLELTNDLKDSQEIQRHFTHWVTKGLREGFILPGGTLKNPTNGSTGPAPGPPGRTAREAETDLVLGQFDRNRIRKGATGG